jgi:TRAP-type mannitol/chloroaromatic compound transport system substrate-binding protein
MREIRFLLMLVILVAGCGVLFALPSLASDKVTKWRMQVLWDPGTTPYKVGEQYVERIKSATGGRLEIKLHAPGTLVPTNEMLDAVQSGMIEMMWQYEGYYIGKMPEVAFTSSLPLGFTDTWQFETWFWKLGGVEFLRKSYAKHGVHYIAPTIYGEEPIHSRVPIRSVDEFKGKKGRFVGLAGPVMAKLGVAVSPMATAEVYSALETGVVDIADRGGLAANYDAGLYEVAKYIILPGFHQPTTATCFAANSDAWNKLPEDVRVIVESVSKEFSMELFQENLVKDFAALKNFKEKGVEIIVIPEDEIRKIRTAAMEVWEEYAAKSPEAGEIFASQKEWMQLIGLIE